MSDAKTWAALNPNRCANSACTLPKGHEGPHARYTTELSARVREMGDAYKRLVALQARLDEHRRTSRTFEQAFDDALRKTKRVDFGPPRGVTVVLDGGR